MNQGKAELRNFLMPASEAKRHFQQQGCYSGWD